jgi:hypothetical protein
MKMKTKNFFLFLFLLSLVSCSGDGDLNMDGNVDDQITVTELSLNRPFENSIATEGDIDWYHYRAVEANRILQVRCSSNTYRPDVDLLVTAYELDENTNEKVRIYATHAREDSKTPADITMNIFIERPKDIYIAVRDLNDNDFSDNLYYVTVDFSLAVEDNDNFSGAKEIIPDNDESCQTDSIGYIGDIDVFKFTVAESGIFDINIDFSIFEEGTKVDLSFDLYDSNGDVLATLSRSQIKNYHLIPFLEPGEYYLLIDDFGRNDFDTASTFKVCLNTLESDEKKTNDSQIDAMTISNSNAMNGSLDYWEDTDWYRIPVVSQNGIDIINFSFDDTGEDLFNYYIEIIDSSENVLLSHTFTGGSEAYNSQIRAGSGDNYLRITASPGQVMTAKAPYSLAVDVLTRQDPGEDGQANDNIENAVTLENGINMEGKIAFRGDQDWYRIQIPDTSAPQILELFASGAASTVEYELFVLRDQVIKRLFDSDGSDGLTLKTSILVPVISSTPGEVYYYFKINDYQGDDGSDSPYTIMARLQAIPDTGPVDTIYYDEISEQDNTSTLEIVYSSIRSHNYSINTTTLDFSNAVQGVNTQGLTTLTFPWISGFIDYQDDQDWFQIINLPLTDVEHWYYDMQVQIVSAGSEVEYVWRYYPDRNQNAVVMQRPWSSDGFIATAGDTSTEVAALDLTVPDPAIPIEDQRQFWFSYRWDGFTYISISDLDVPGADLPENDWGYDAPYSFQVILTYHPDERYPD